jgi:hypothetical protein
MKWLLKLRKSHAAILMIIAAASLLLFRLCANTFQQSQWSWGIFPTISTNQLIRDESSTNFNLVKGRGVVMCAGDDMYMLAGVHHALSTFRFRFGMKMPVSVAHCAELSKDTQREIESSYEGVTVNNLCDSSSTAAQRKRLRR